MSFGGLAGALVAGAAVGVGHAVEADHVAAVATLVDDDTDRAGLVGASWGVGHAVPITLLGLVLVALGVRLPAAVTAAVEVLVGLVLVVLGARTLWRSRRAGHDHAGGSHGHLRLGGVSLGAAHAHPLRSESLAVGVLHGVAGSGALVVLLVSTAASVGSALAFLAGFALLSVGTMAAVSFAWGEAVTAGRGIEALAGLASIAVGGFLIVEQIGGVA